MKRSDPATLSDEALLIALAMTEALVHVGSLGARTRAADEARALQSELDRRTCERMWRVAS